MKLKKYQQKRDFKKSAEPKGKVGAKRRGKKLYIIQKHAASHLHYDFRLELDGVLLSWAVPKGPCLDPSVKRLAMHVEDHPLEYGKFEGIIPKGQYGGGTVMLWDKGEWISDDDNPRAAYAKGNMKFTLKAAKLNGKWKLIRMHGDDKTWLLIKIDDDYAEPLNKFDITREEPNSVVSNCTMDEIAEHCEGRATKKSAKTKKSPAKLKKNIKINLQPARFPTSISPQLATLVGKPPQEKNWVHEIKFDGYRIVAFKRNDKTRLLTRNHNDWTPQFKTIANIIDKLALPDVVFDGEIVVLDDEQRSNFQLLQNSIKSDSGRPYIYYVFDLLYYDKYNLLSLPLLERKKILKTLLDSVNHPQIRYSDHVSGSGVAVFDKACKLGLEGIVSKDADAPYIQKRGKSWLKSKCIKRQEFVIGGYTKPQRSRKYFGSLLLGTFNKKKQLVYNGNVGTGFTESSLKNIYQLLQQYKTDQMPYNKLPPACKKATWVKPVLVAEVEFTEWTQDNALRHPSFKGLRTDKPAKQITKESEVSLKKITTAKGESPMLINITHPDKILYKEDKIDKQQLVDYYHDVYKWIMPYVQNRLLTIVRCPSDYNKCFYQKHIDKSYSSAFHQVTVQDKHKKEKYFYIDDEEGLLTLPQLGVLEIHPWNSTIDELEHPDMLIFDLDPADSLPWKKVVSAAFELKEHLAKLKLRSFVKTTGGKGLHVVVPIVPEYSWDDVKQFAHAFVNYIQMQHPDRYVTKMAKASRVGKIFLDYLRNQRGATSVAPYSTRARIHAPVATPLHWDELSNDKRENTFTIETIPDRLQHLKKDPWKDFFKLKQSLRIKERLEE